MKEDDFTTFLKHFIKNVRSSVEHPVWLLLDNHGSHLSLKGFNLAEENGTVMLTFPPHCSHKFQPLDRSVYGPLKKYVNSACDAFIHNHARCIIGVFKSSKVQFKTVKIIQIGFYPKFLDWYLTLPHWRQRFLRDRSLLMDTVKVTGDQFELSLQFWTPLVIRFHLMCNMG